MLVAEDLPAPYAEDGGSGATVVGFATLPHYDERVMYGNEVRRLWPRDRVTLALS